MCLAPGVASRGPGGYGAAKGQPLCHHQCLHAIGPLRVPNLFVKHMIYKRSCGPNLPC